MTHAIHTCPRWGQGTLLAYPWGGGTAPFVVTGFDYRMGCYLGRVWVHSRGRFYGKSRRCVARTAVLADGLNRPAFQEARVAAQGLFA